MGGLPVRGSAIRGHQGRARWVGDFRGRQQTAAREHGNSARGAPWRFAVHGRWVENRRQRGFIPLLSGEEHPNPKSLGRSTIRSEAAEDQDRKDIGTAGASLNAAAETAG